MRVAVVGAGLAGLATVFHLLENGFEVSLFFHQEGASFASTGLLHKAPGKKAIPTPFAEEGMRETEKLLEKVDAMETCFDRRGILRIAVDEEQKKRLGGERVWIQDGKTVFSKRYLKGLKKLCQKAEMIDREIHSIQELDGFDVIILTVGEKIFDFTELALKKNIGQALICRVKEPLEMSILSKGHISVTEDPEICLVGSTYEHGAFADSKKAKDLLSQVSYFYPKAKEFTILDILQGVRVAPKIGALPLIKEIQENVWVFTGLGSRGLIYHSLLAKRLVSQIISKGSCKVLSSF